MKPDHRGIGLTSQRARNRLIDQLREMGISTAAVLDVMGKVPRHVFVDEALASRAYENTALPIGLGQTISQPYIVARMTEALYESGPMGRVMEIGGGCGYQAVILAEFAQEVFSIERLSVLASRLRERLYALNRHSIRVRHGDGYQGWAEYAPFDAILSAAAAPAVPAKWLEQLACGGRLVMPLGAPGQQELVRVTRYEEGLVEERLERVSFVPLLEGIA
jgi:protein-L-isoaspartate(D-aspartate) O-methyltransferase